MPATATKTATKTVLATAILGLLLMSLCPLRTLSGADIPLLVRSQPVVITITGLSQVYNGQPHAVTITTVPAGISTEVLYAGSTSAPSAPGSYAVSVTVTQANFSGSASATEIISAGSTGTGATTGTTGGTTSVAGTTSGSSSSGNSSSSSSSSTFLNGLPCGLGSGSALILGGGLWWRRRR